MNTRSIADAWPRLVALLVFVAALATHRHAPLWPGDGTAVVLAKALSEGEGLRYLFLPDAPPAIAAGALYPAILALMWKAWPAFPENQALFQLFDAAALGVAAWVLLAHARRRRLHGSAVWLAIPAGFLAAPVLAGTGMRMGAPLVLLLTAAAASLADDESPSPARAAWAGALAGLTVWLFPGGLVVLGGVVAALLLRGLRRQAVVALGLGVAIAAPVLWSLRGGGSLAAFLASPNAGLIGGFREAVAPLPIAVAITVIVGAALISVWGAVVVYANAPSMITVFGAILPATLFLNPGIPGLSCIVIPVLAAWFAGGVAWMVNRTAAIRRAAFAVTIAFVIAAAVWQWTGLRRLSGGPAHAAAMRLAVLSIVRETSPAAVIASDHSALLYLLSARHAVPIDPPHQPGGDAASVIRRYCDSGVTHLVSFDPSSRAAAVARVLQDAAERPVTPLFSMTGGASLFGFRCPG